MTEDNTSDKDEKRLKIDKLCLLEYACLRGLFVSSPMYFHSSWHIQQEKLDKKPKRCLKNRECNTLLMEERKYGREREGEVGCKQEDEES